jgi:hypothetical protein
MAKTGSFWFRKKKTQIKQETEKLIAKAEELEISEEPETEEEKEVVRPK